MVGTAISGSEIQLNWEDNSGNEQGFVLERSGDGYVTRFTMPANVASYLDTRLTSLES